MIGEKQKIPPIAEPTPAPAEGKYHVLKLGPISSSNKKKINDIIKWEDDSAKAHFVISRPFPKP